MAELLVYAKNNRHKDPTEQRRGSWQVGHVVHVAPDGHTWGNSEGPPTFWKVRVEGAPVDLFQELLGTAQSRILGPTGRPFLVARRKLLLDIPQNLQVALDTGDVVAVSLSDLRSYYHDNASDAQILA